MDIRTAPASLPREVWEQIAGHFGLREWAQVSGTCKVTWELQLQDIHITENDRLGAAGVAWLVKRAYRARTLFWEQLSGEALEALALPFLHGPQSFGNLAALAFNQRCAMPYVSSPEEEELLFVLWMWLAGQARQLHFLSLSMKKLKFLPHFQHLKHLQLQLFGADCSTVVQSIPLALGSLETLYLYCLNLSKTEGPVLQLASMPHLRSVSLEGVLPAWLELPEGTALHVRLHSLFQASHEVWQNVLPNLRTFYLDSRLCVIDLSVEEKLPQFLFEPSNIETLVLCGERFGTLKAPIHLRGSFLQAERLAIFSDHDVYFAAPSGRAWKLVNFHANGCLDMILENANHFADTCPEFSFKFKSQIGMSITLLTHFISERGVEWEWSTNEDTCFINSSCDDFRSMLVFTDEYSPFFLCRCQACWCCCNRW